MTDLITYGQQYLQQGFSILRTDDNKHPVGLWAELQQQAIAPDEVGHYLSHPKVKGLGIITGKVSGNLEVIDVDTKHSTNPNLFEELTQAIMELDASLFPRLTIARTPSGGYHIYYRCPDVTLPGNKKLSSREVTDAEQAILQSEADAKADEAGKQRKELKRAVRCFIETRGEGGYVAAVPSAGYSFEQGDTATVPAITANERDVIWAAVYSLNEYTPEPYVRQAPEADADYEGGIKPGDDYNKRGDAVALLESHGWTVVREDGPKVRMKRPGTTDSVTSGDFHRTKNLFSVFSTSTQFNPQEGYSPWRVYGILEHGGDWKAAAKALAAEGYGVKGRRVKKDGGSSNTNDAELLTFWHVEFDDKRKVNVTTVVRHKFLAFLHDQGGFGLYRYDPTQTGYILIRNSAGIVSPIASEHIRKFVLAYIETLPEWFDGIHRDTLLEVFLKNEAILKPGYLENLPRIEPAFLKDTAETAYYPFRNGVVCITRDGTEVRSLAEIGKCVWARQIIDRDIAIDNEVDPEQIVFYEFLRKISGGDQDRLLYCMSLMGYLLHGHKKASNSFCVIMCEETELKGGVGGTGKGILYKALGKLVPWVFLDGKNKNMDGQFMFDQVEPDTQMLVVDDVPKSFPFERVFTIITEGVLVEKKYLGKVFIPYDDSPKLVITTNFVIDANSTAALRRQRNLEFARFFHSGYTPKQHFGHELFDDWDEREWTRFYNLMFACVRQFLTAGVPAREVSTSLKRRALTEKYGDRILEFYEEYAAGDGLGWRLFADVYHEFLEVEGTETKYYSAKKFRAGLDAVAALSDQKIEEQKTRATNKKKEIRLVGSLDFAEMGTDTGGGNRLGTDLF